MWEPVLRSALVRRHSPHLPARLATLDKLSTPLARQEINRKQTTASCGTPLSTKHLLIIIVSRALIQDKQGL